jgi:predicted RNA-binding protein YlxR (DUF448 family)
MRLCLGCNTQKPKRDLIRIVRTPDGTVAIDRKGKMNGRGAYVCSRACLEVAAKGRLQHELAVPVPEAILEELRAALPT